MTKRERVRATPHDPSYQASDIDRPLVSGAGASSYAGRLARLRRSQVSQKCEYLLSVSNTEFE
jgi:hypothetical protein